MLRFVFFLAVSCALAWAAVWVVNHPGTVVVQWLDQELILSVGTVIAALFAIGALAVILFEVLRVIVGLPGSWRASRGRRTQVRGYEELTRGLMAVAAGDLNAARNYHRQAERHLPDNGSLLLLQAQTAQLEGIKAAKSRGVYKGRKPSIDAAEIQRHRPRLCRRDSRLMEPGPA